MTHVPSTNLRVLKPSRRRLQAGDLFVMQPDEQFLFGRVVTTEALLGPMSGVIVIYIYRPRFATTDEPARSDLSRDDLLVAPIMTNRLPWSRGYFETIANWPLELRDVLDQHCFWNVVRRQYVDEADNELPGPVEPVGRRALHSFRTIDDAVSKAIGIPLTPG